MDRRRRAEKGARGLAERASIGMLVNHPIYIYIFVRFVATDNRPRHRRPGNLNFGTRHTVLPRILSVYRFHTRVTSPPPFSPFRMLLPSTRLERKKYIFRFPWLEYLLRIWNISDYIFRANSRKLSQRNLSR